MDEEIRQEVEHSQLYGLGKRFEDILEDIHTCSHRYWEPGCNASEETRLLTLAAVLSRLCDLLPLMEEYNSSKPVLIRYYEDAHTGLLPHPDKQFDLFKPANPQSESGKKLEEHLLNFFGVCYADVWGEAAKCVDGFTSISACIIVSFAKFWDLIRQRLTLFTTEDFCDIYDYYADEFRRNKLPQALEQQNEWMDMYNDLGDERDIKYSYDNYLLHWAATFIYPTMGLLEAMYTIEKTYINEDGTIKKQAVGKYIYEHRANQSTVGVAELMEWSMMRDERPPRSKEIYIAISNRMKEVEMTEESPETFSPEKEKPKHNLDYLLSQKIADKLDFFKADIYALLDKGATICTTKLMPYTIYQVLLEKELIAKNEQGAAEWFATTFTIKNRWTWRWKKVAFSDIEPPFTYPIDKWLAKTNMNERCYPKVLALTAFAQRVREALAGY